MPRRERDWEIARRRKRKKESRKLRAKGLLGSPPEGMKEGEKKKPEKAVKKEAPQEAPKETPKPEVPKEGEGPSTQEGQPKRLQNVDCGLQIEKKDFSF